MRRAHTVVTTASLGECVKSAGTTAASERCGERCVMPSPSRRSEVRSETVGSGTRSALSTLLLSPPPLSPPPLPTAALGVAAAAAPLSPAVSAARLPPPSTR
eukprot:4156490-Pleurochrysis_carterae.AAC.1